MELADKTRLKLLGSAGANRGERVEKFHEVVFQDTPRLVVAYRRDGESDMFQWGVVGTIPMLTLVGCVSRVQVDLARGDCWPDDCPQSALVVAWDEVERAFQWFCHREIPVDPLLGMLEVVKAVIVQSHHARQQGAQQVRILGPDGEPVRRGV